MNACRWSREVVILEYKGRSIGEMLEACSMKDQQYLLAYTVSMDCIE